MPITLQFSLESDAALAKPDYFEVVVYRVQNGLHPERVYMSTDLPAIRVTPVKLTIDPTVFVPNTEYVFAIRTYRGRPDAPSGDFRRATYPQAVGTVFTRSFLAK